MDDVSLHWQLLIVSLPSNSTTLRMRIWRALKALGCAALRDGVYLLPWTAALEEQLRGLADEVASERGTAWLPAVQARSKAEDEAYRALFDRAAEYREWTRAVADAGQALAGMTPQDVQRTLRKLRREYDALRSIDYFPNDASARAEAAWMEFAKAAERRMAPGEPQAGADAIVRR